MNQKNNLLATWGASTASLNDEARLNELEKRLGIVFKNRAAAILALTHTSYAHEHRRQNKSDNERLEFLGDAVLDLAVSDRLMNHYPAANEGELSKLRAAVVNEEGLATIARAIGLGELLLLGRGEELTRGREKNSVLADAFEAVIGAIYLGSGLELVLEVIDRFFSNALATSQETVRHDYKTHLQEKVQEQFKSPPRYKVISEQGPDHSKIFCVEIEAGGVSLSRGEGRSKKDAEQAAAREALRLMNLSPSK